MSNIDKSIFVSQLDKGEKVFHYTSAEGLMGISSGEIWVTEKNFLNDSTEFSVATEVFCEVMADHIHNKEVCDNICQALRDEMIRLDTPGKLGEDIPYTGDYVISLCLDNDSIVMWSEYSEFFGYCMGFDLDSLLEYLKDTPGSMLHGRVIYNRKEQYIAMEKSIEEEFINDKFYELINSWEDFEALNSEVINDFVAYSSIIVSIYNMFFKRECFAAEREYRIVFTAGHDGELYSERDKEKQYFRNKNGVLIPYIKKKFNMDSLKSVMIGPKNNIDIAEKGLRYYFRNIKLNVDIEKSKIPLRY